MSSQRIVIGHEDLKRLKDAKLAGTLRKCASDLAEELIGTAESYRELRDELSAIIREMKDTKGVQAQATTFDKIRDRLEAAIATEISQ